MCDEKDGAWKNSLKECKIIAGHQEFPTTVVFVSDRRQLGPANIGETHESKYMGKAMIIGG